MACCSIKISATTSGKSRLSRDSIELSGETVENETR
jgi:hypothetical protein